MSNVLTIDYDKCTGCRTCEMACSLMHENMVNPALSRILIVKGDIEGEGVPVICSQCDPAPCISVCPTEARARDSATGRVITKEERCIHCRTCMAVCPFGAIGYNPLDKKIFSCDHCDGTPQCVEFCGYDALHYVDEIEAKHQFAREAAARVNEARKQGVSASGDQGVAC